MTTNHLLFISGFAAFCIAVRVARVIRERRSRKPQWLIVQWRGFDRPEAFETYIVDRRHEGPLEEPAKRIHRSSDVSRKDTLDTCPAVKLTARDFRP